MTDFHQEGIITTVHSLYDSFDRNEYLVNLERKLEKHSRHRRIILLLPSLFSEIENINIRNFHLMTPARDCTEWW